MKSPFNNADMELRKEIRELEFRKEKFKIVYQFWYDKESKEGYTTGEQDDVHLNQVYNQYREKHNLPFPDEIKRTREKYDLPATKMSEILGFGVNTYRNYEDGEVPADANAKLIQLAKNSEVFKSLVRMSSGLDEKFKEKLIAKIEALEKEEDESVEVHFQPVLTFHKKGEYSGYRELSLERFREMIVYFADKLQPWTTQLNKLFFYADFLQYKKSGYSISGMNYRAVEMGPILADYKTLFEYVQETKCVDVITKAFDHGIGEQFKPNKHGKFQKGLFEKSELETLETVVKKFGKMKTKDIVAQTHKEKGWKENEKKRELISYKWAFEIELA